MLRATVACIGAASVARAQPESAIRQPDPGRGAGIAAQAVAPGVLACAQCHARNGGGADGSGSFPRIAGQSAWYLAKQLRDYASGVRLNAVMAPIAKALSSEDIADVTAYYASVNAPYPPLARPNPALTKRGEQLAKAGNAAPMPWPTSPNVSTPRKLRQSLRISNKSARRCACKQQRRPHRSS